jgi:uncharacterized protein (DUF2267 family)
MDVDRFYRDIAERLGLDEQDTFRAAGAVMMALHLRMREEAARQVEARLPPKLRKVWEHGGEALKEERGGYSDFSRVQFIDYVGDRLEVRASWRSEEIIRVVLEALRAQLPELDVVVRPELPDDLLDLWAGHIAPQH